MTRYKPGDLDRLGAAARRQIEATRFAFRARDKLAAEKTKPGDRASPTPGKKFGNVKTKVDGRTFDSKLEAERYWTLKTLQRSGFISELVCQPEFPIAVNGIRIAVYRADFAYYDADGNYIVEDVKSPTTAKLPTYRIKRKLVAAIHGITIREILP